MFDTSNFTEIRVKTKKQKTSPFDRRIALIDFLRGILILLVCFDHFMYDCRDFLPEIFELAGVSSGGFYDFCHDFIFSRVGSLNYFDHPVRNAIRAVALESFVLLSGISCAFSRDNYKRAAKMSIFWLGLMFISNVGQGIGYKTDLWEWPLAINFNIIGVIALCVLIYCFVQKRDTTFMFFFMFGLAVFSYILLPMLTDYLKGTPSIFFPFWKGSDITIIGPNGNQIPYYQADYMSLCPYIVFFFIGVIISKIFYEHPKDHLAHNYKFMKPIAFCGRHSLAFYILHQFVFIGFLFIVKYIVIWTH